jgi:hypothetical protein
MVVIHSTLICSYSNPTTVCYNTMSSLVRFEKKLYLKTLKHTTYNAGAVVVRLFSRRIGSRIEICPKFEARSLSENIVRKICPKSLS